MKIRSVSASMARALRDRSRTAPRLRTGAVVVEGRIAQRARQVIREGAEHRVFEVGPHRGEVA